MYGEWVYGRADNTRRENPPQVATFATDFNVTFGMLICVDLEWETPIEQYIALGVRDFAFSAQWVNPPEDQQVPTRGIFQAWSRAYGVNLLAANEPIEAADGVVGGGGGLFSAGRLLHGSESNRRPQRAGVLSAVVSSPPAEAPAAETWSNDEDGDANEGSGGGRHFRCATEFAVMYGLLNPEYNTNSLLNLETWESWSAPGNCTRLVTTAASERRSNASLFRASQRGVSCSLRIEGGGATRAVAASPSSGEANASSCGDDASWVDPESGSDCSGWVGYDCAATYKGWASSGDVLERCPATCGLCGGGGGGSGGGEASFVLMAFDQNVKLLMSDEPMLLQGCFVFACDELESVPDAEYWRACPSSSDSGGGCADQAPTGIGGFGHVERLDPAIVCRPVYHAPGGAAIEGRLRLTGEGLASNAVPFPMLMQGEGELASPSSLGVAERAEGGGFQLSTVAAAAAPRLFMLGVANLGAAQV